MVCERAAWLRPAIAVWRGLVGKAVAAGGVAGLAAARVSCGAVGGLVARAVVVAVTREYAVEVFSSWELPLAGTAVTWGSL